MCIRDSIVITGTTSGTGYTAAEACGKLGAKVVLLNRPSERAKNSFEKLKETTSNGSFHSIDSTCKVLLQCGNVSPKLMSFVQRALMCSAIMPE